MEPTSAVAVAAAKVVVPAMVEKAPEAALCALAVEITTDAYEAVSDTISDWWDDLW